MLEKLFSEPTNFYVFIGEEWKLKQIYIEQIAANLHAVRRSVDTVLEACKLARTARLFARTRTVYVVAEDNSFITDARAWAALDAFENDVLILILTKLDNRLKFAKTWKSQIFDFDSVAAGELVVQCQQRFDISDRVAKSVLDICGDLGQTLFELDKVFRAYDVESLSSDDIERAVKSGLIYLPPQDAIFKFTDALLVGDRAGAFELCSECQRFGTHALQLLSVVYTNARNILQVQTSGSAVARSTGLSTWQIKHAKEKCGVYSADHLVDLLELVMDICDKIKQGQLAENIAVDYLIIKFMLEV